MKWLRDSFRFAFQGVAEMFRSQASARLEALVAIAVIIAGFIFEIDRLEWVAVIFAIGLVLAAEAFNTALEHLADAVHPERHPLVGKAKDAAAGAALIASIAAAAIGLIVFLPKLIACLKP